MTNWPRIIARKVTPVSQWMTIVSRDVQFSPGAEAETYYAIQQPSYLAAVALTPEGRILLVRQYRPAIERFSFEFPAGLIEENEGDPANAMARELLEETGYTTESITLIGHTATCSSRISNCMYSFFIRARARVPGFVEEPGVSVSSVTRGELWDLVRSGEFSEQTRPSKLARGHHAAMPYEDVAAFTAKLRKREATSALALEMCILTAARTGEILGTRWPEIDLDKKIWTVPANRMKAGREHRVPLSPRAFVILRQLEKLKSGDFVFPGQKPKSPFSGRVLQMVLRKLGFKNATVHGFRSSFRDWAGNVSHFPREITETALAHVVGDKAEQAYRRSDALEKRRKLMEAWAAYCEPKTAANVVSMRRQKSS